MTWQVYHTSENEEEKKSQLLLLILTKKNIEKEKRKFAESLGKTKRKSKNTFRIIVTWIVNNLNLNYKMVHCQ